MCSTTTSKTEASRGFSEREEGNLIERFRRSGQKSMLLLVFSCID